MGRVLASLEALQFRRWGSEGLTISQLRVLYLLRDSGRASVGAVAEHLGITPSTATALVDRLVQRGLVERGAREGDRRVVELHLSAVGSEHVEEAVRCRRRDLTGSLDELSEGDRERLAELLEELAERLEHREAAKAEHTAAHGEC